MKFCVIGLGRFGYSVAVELAENDMEVMAIDSNESIVASIRDQVTQAICMHVTDESSLREVGVEEMDTVIVAMGENFAQSILMTALLKKRLKTPFVIARGINEIHKEILQLIGADRIILPEKEIGVRLADKLSLPFTDLIRLTKQFSISYTDAPAPFVGKSVVELDLYNTYTSYCVGLQYEEHITPIAPSYEIKSGDKLVFAGNNDDLERIAKLS